jgi:hypothetical protein
MRKLDADVVAGERQPDDSSDGRPADSGVTTSPARWTTAVAYGSASPLCNDGTKEEDQICDERYF